MLRIDAHHHYWRYQPQDYPWIDDDMPQLRRDFYPPQLQSLLAQHRLDGAVVVQARHDENETAWLVEQVSQMVGVRGVVGWLDITAADLEDKLTQWRDQLCGLRHQVQDEADPAAWLEREAVSRGMRRLQQRGYSWDLLVTHRHLAAAARFAARHDDHWLVLDHFGKPDIARGAAHWAEQARPLAALPHVVGKLALCLILPPRGCRITACGGQTFRPGDRSRARMLDRAATAAFLRRRAGAVWPAAADVWFRLAGMPAGGGVPPGLPAVRNGAGPADGNAAVSYLGRHCLSGLWFNGGEAWIYFLKTKWLSSPVAARGSARR